MLNFLKKKKFKKNPINHNLPILSEKSQFSIKIFTVNKPNIAEDSILFLLLLKLEFRIIILFDSSKKTPDVYPKALLSSEIRFSIVIFTTRAI